MGLQFELINFDKKEIISFEKVNSGLKLKELSANDITSTIVTYYMLKNRGDKISFIDDHTEKHELFGETYNYSDFNIFQDKTEIVINELIENNILENEGGLEVDEEMDIYYYDLKKVKEK